MSCLIITWLRQNISIPSSPISSRNDETKNSKRLFHQCPNDQLTHSSHFTCLMYNPHHDSRLHDSRLRHINLGRPAQIIAIPISACAAYTSRLLDIIDVRSGRTTLSPSATTRAAASNWRLVADVRCIAAAPRSGKSEYSPQPEDEEGSCDRTDDDTCNPPATDCAWAVIAAGLSGLEDGIYRSLGKQKALAFMSSKSMRSMVLWFGPRAGC